MWRETSPKGVTERVHEPPACNLGLEWESPWQEFRTSVRDFVAGPRPTKDGLEPDNPALRAHWIRGRLPAWAFAVSCLWHIAIVTILILPIWGFLPRTESTLAPVQIEVTYVPAQDLPPISLPATTRKISLPARNAEAASTPARDSGADAYHPRQTILSVPVRVTHPRQTLIQPDAPPAAPKIDAQLPNMVHWASPNIPKVELQLTPVATAPRARGRVVRDMPAPEVAAMGRSPIPLDIGDVPVENPRLQMPVSSMSVAAKRLPTHADAAAAPEIGTASSSNDASLRRLIALSETPAPPAPEVAVPNGNLAASVAISPDGRKGVPGDPKHGSANIGLNGSNTSPNGGNAEGTGADSLPAAISIRGGISRPGGVSPGRTSNGLNLTPPAATMSRPIKGPSVVGTIRPNVQPEEILLGKEVHTLDINLPNLTSVTGSWILDFAELYEETQPFRPEQLSGPVPFHKVDPKYPSELMKEHVEGEVVLYAIIRKDGSVHDIQVVKGLDPVLDKNAIEALSQWKFRPGMRGGVPVDLEAVVYIPFRYRNAE